MITKILRILQQEQFTRHPVRAAVQLGRRLQWHLHWKFNPGTPVYQDLPGGLRIRLGHTSTSYGMFLGRGYCDREAVEIIGRHLGPGSVMLDCGAHIGEFTLAGAAAIGRDAEIHCFEPDPRNFAILKENVRLNHLDRVVVNPCAVGEQDGEVTFHLGLDPTASSVGMESHTRTIDDITVRVRNLSDYANEHELTRVDFLKIDVEGAEFAAVKGAADLLRKHKPGLLFIECDDHDNEIPVTEFLTNLGYRVVRRGHGGIHPHLFAYLN
ncbi:MAG: FkbM family methyltransferase [Verrucomicrobiota bacterium]